MTTLYKPNWLKVAVLLTVDRGASGCETATLELNTHEHGRAALQLADIMRNAMALTARAIESTKQEEKDDI